MKSRTTGAFRDQLAALPEEVQRRARQAYRQFQADPSHPSLHLKAVNTRTPMYSARAGIHYRALGVRRDDSVVWFWIGSHDEYEELLSRL